MSTDPTEQVADSETDDPQTDANPHDTEAYEALQSALDDVFYEPVQEKVKRVSEQVEDTLGAHEETIGSDFASLKENLSKFLSAVERSHEEIDREIDTVKSLSSQAYSLLTDDQEDSRLERITETLNFQSEELQDQSQDLENLAEEQREHAAALEGQKEDLQECLSRIQNLDQRLEELTSEVKQGKKQSDERTQEIMTTIEGDHEWQQWMLIGLSVWMGLITIALGLLAYQVV